MSAAAVRRMAVIGAVVTGTLLAAAVAAVAQTMIVLVEDVVSVEPGPARQNYLIRHCTDVALGVEERRSFVLRRTGTADTPLTVTYVLSGSAQPGVHYDPLPGSVTFAPGSATAVVDVAPRPSPDGAIVDLTLTATGANGPVSFSPSSATIQYVSPPPPGPVECGYRFTDDPWNTSQTVAVGQPLHPLTLEQVAPPSVRPATGRFRLVGGTLPPGVTLREDGSFAGAPIVPGTFTSRIEACRPAPPGTCVTTDLTVTSQGSAADVGGAVGAVVTDRVVVLVQQLVGLIRQLFAALGIATG